MADKIIIPPHNYEAERSVMGSILIDEEAIYKVADFLQPRHFYDPKHKDIFSVMVELFVSNKALDLLTLTSSLKKKKMLKKVGGVSYITEIVESVPTSSHVEEYARIIKECCIRRDLMRVGSEYTSLASEEDEPIDKVLDQAEQKLFSIAEDSSDRDYVHVSKLLEAAYERAEEIDKKKEKIRGVKTGLQMLDGLLGGLQESDLIILAARPSVGKSALALDIARYAATHGKKNVGIFSLEMSNMQVMDRLLAMQVGTSLWDLRMGRLSDRAFDRLSDSMGILSESGLYIDDTPGMHIMELMTKARRMKLEHKIDLIVVDYLQLIQGRSRENRVQEVSEISRLLKNIARELEIPVLACSQLSRAVESRTDRIPQLSDLRESGSIEQDADVVMFIHREEMYNRETERKGVADLIVAKHRNGPVGQIELYFVKEQARFRELEKSRGRETVEEKE